MGKQRWFVPVITVLALLIGTAGCGNAQSGISAITLPPDGALLVSDDRANVVHRISYDGRQ
jgi:glucose/arabinose dehydrogenase